MSRPIHLIALASLSLLVLAACGPRDDEPTTGFNRPGQRRPPVVAEQPTPPPTPTPPVRERENNVPPPPANTPPPRQEPVDYPYATPVPGSPGFVKSPYAPEAGLVDVRGMSPGQQARNPYTGKVFLVP